MPRLIFAAEVQDCRVLHDPAQIMLAGAADEIHGVVPHIVVPENIVYGLCLLTVRFSVQLLPA